jgi:molybdopterin-guanine dinucleotide biosynthesis protein A
MENALDAGQKRIIAFFPHVKVTEIGARELSALDPDELSFCNINTPQEYFRLRDGVRTDRLEIAMEREERTRREA